MKGKCAPNITHGSLISSRYLEVDHQVHWINTVFSWAISSTCLWWSSPTLTSQDNNQSKNPFFHDVPFSLPFLLFLTMTNQFSSGLTDKKRGKTQMISQGRPAIVSLSKRENRLISLKCEFQKPLRKKPASHFFQLVAFFTARAFMKYNRASKVKHICFFINLLNTFYLSLFFFFLILSDRLTLLLSAFSDVCRRPNYQSTFFAHYLENFTMSFVEIHNFYSFCCLAMDSIW